MIAPRLRLGVIVDREWLPRWQLEVVRALEAGGDVEMCTVVAGREPGGAPTTRPRSIWRLYNNRVVARRAASVRRAATWDALVPDATRLDVTVTRRGRWSQYVTDDDLERIRAEQLDVLVRFGLGILRGDILTVARFGVWSFHHDDERVVRGGPPSFWEVFDGEPTTGVLLQRLTDRLDGGIPLARATFRTVSHSYPRNRDRVNLGAAALPAQVARQVRLGILDPDGLEVSASSAPVRHNPTDREMLRFIARQMRRGVRTRVAGVMRADVWTAGVAGNERCGGGTLEVSRVQWLPEPDHPGYFADPFPARRDGRTAILVEEFDEATNRGVISALEAVADGWRTHRGVIDPGVHASYPFLVEEGGELYCVPETWEAGRVERWRCVSFPDQWERADVLVDAPVVDPTVFRHDGRWWLLGTRRDDDPDTKLWCWHAPELAGPWTAHTCNPLKIDVSSSRPAGTPFVVDDVLYRPAQDCSTAYGSAVVVNRVDCLGDAGLVESPVPVVVRNAGKYGAGTHTLSRGGGIITIDGRRYGTSRHRMVREFRARVRKLVSRTTP